MAPCIFNLDDLSMHPCVASNKLELKLKLFSFFNGPLKWLQKKVFHFSKRRDTFHT